MDLYHSLFHHEKSNFPRTVNSIKHVIEISLMIHYVYYDCVQFGRLLKQQIEAFILKPLTD